MGQIRSRAVFLGLLTLLSAPHGASAQDVRPAPLLLEGLFQDRAVVQRERPIPIWGKARPGEDVSISFGPATAKARADRTGRWSASLPRMSAGGPYRLSVLGSGGGRHVVEDVLVGDVWLCSGQSNMEMDVSRALNAPGEIGSAGDDGIRLLTVGHNTAPTPAEGFRTPVRWQAASPASVADFSAVCYFMARDLRASQKVPIGLIDASWGGTAIDAWRSEAAIEKGGGYADRLAILRAYRSDPVEGNRLWGAVWEKWWRSGSGDARGADPWRAAAATGWKPVPQLTNWERWGEPALANFNGMVWYRNTFTLTAEQAAKPASIGIGWADDLDQTWVNGAAVGNGYGSGNDRDYALPRGLLKAGENVVVVNVLDTYGAGGLSGPDALRRIRFGDGTSVPLGSAWSYEMVPASVGWPPRAPWESIAGLSSIYNGMIAPLGGYGLRGVAWYQGESDAGNERGYAAKLASLMADWRRHFGQRDLPFLVVQLAGWGAASASPQESGSAIVRDEQRRAVAADPHAGLAVTIDIGDRVDIHPANKQDVAHRLSRAARHVAYGEAVTPSGPEPVAARRTGSAVTVAFANMEGGLVAYSSDRPIGFELCGPAPGSCRYVAASLAGSVVTLDAAGGPADRVRFCWGDSPICNLYDRAGLPAGPFELKVQ